MGLKGETRAILALEQTKNEKCIESEYRYRGDCPFEPDNFDYWPEMPQICLYAAIDCRASQHFLGHGNKKLQMSWSDYYYIDFVLTRFQNIKHVVECGTFGGVTSLYFGMVTRGRGGELHSFDIFDHRPASTKSGWLDNMLFHREDILYDQASWKSELELNFGDKNPNVIQLIQRNNTLAFYDSIKCLEIKMYAQFQPVGSVFLTHDWDTEVNEDCIRETLQRHNFIPLYTDLASSIGTRVRGFQRTNGPIKTS